MNNITKSLSAGILSIMIFLFISVDCKSNNLSEINTTKNIIAPTYDPAQPSKNEIRINPITGRSITRITDTTELKTTEDALVVYSRFTATNSTGEYLLVHGKNSTSAWIIRLSDNAVLHKVNPGVNVGASNDEIGEVHEIRWDYSGQHPNRIYFIYGMKFYQMDVIDGNDSSTLLHDFSVEYPSGKKIMNDVEGDSSNDSRYWAWMVIGTTIVDGKQQPDLFIVYDKQTNTIIGEYTPSDNPNYTTYLPRPNMVEISPEGSKVILHYGTASNHPFVLPGGWANEGNGIYSTNYKAYTAGNSVFAYIKVNDTLITQMSTGTGTPASITGNNQFAYNSELDRIYIRFDGTGLSSHVVSGNWGSRPQDNSTILDGPHAFSLNFTNPVKVAISESHSGWGYSSTGKELFISQDNTRDRFQACYIDGTGGTYPNNCFDFFNHANWNYAGVHFGKFYNSDKRGWVLASTYKKANDTWGANQIIMMELKDIAEDPTCLRVTPSYNQYAGNYRDEAPAALSLDGNNIYWTANWGDATNGHGEVYHTQLPANWTNIKPYLIAPIINKITDKVNP